MMGIAEVLAEGRLIRDAWSREENGRQLLCLYTAMVGDPEARPQHCPADVCPLWLAHMIPWIDDAGSEAHWHSVVARVARLAPHFGRLPVATEWRVRALCVREAMRHTQQADVLALCERVERLCSAVTNTTPQLKKLATIAEDAWLDWIGKVAEPGDAADRASIVAYAAAMAASSSPCQAGRAASEATRAASSPREAADTIAAAKESAADRLIDAILDEIERSLEAA